MNSSGLSMEQIKDGMRSAWMAGDFGMVAKTITSGAEEFAKRLGLPPGSRVLDVATGTGNLAIPLARSGCVVTGLDIATNLLEQAQARAAAEGLQITFDEGDAERMPYADGSFDAVVTMFGAMFAPRPELVASELARVLRSGGTLAMANWSPKSFTGQMFRLGAKHVPPPPGIAPPVMWGDEATARERLGAGFREIETSVSPIVFDMPVSPAGAVEFFRTYFGPTKVAFSRLDDAGQAKFAKEMVELWSSANTAETPETHTRVPNEYLEVKAVRS